MITLFEFLDEEPIENIITCLNFKVDKVIFFGYKEGDSKIDQFLTNKCGVKDVIFKKLPKNDYVSIGNIMRSTIQTEKSIGSKIYFDITGGEDVVLVAFGVLSKEFNAPIHLYDVANTKLIELDEGAQFSISRDVEKQHITLDVKEIISLRNACVNMLLHKDIKDIGSKDFADAVDALWRINQKYKKCWNVFSSLLRSELNQDDIPEYSVRTTDRFVEASLRQPKYKSLSFQSFIGILDEMSNAGIIVNYRHSDGNIDFDYKNQLIKSSIWDSGSILELQTYKRCLDEHDDVMVGAHLDWDGVIHTTIGEDVLNEIDVLAVKDGVPTFISCKAGRLNAEKKLHALYELETVAYRFGGKYAKKELVTVFPIEGNYAIRAKEMGIKLTVLK